MDASPDDAHQLQPDGADRTDAPTEAELLSRHGQALADAVEAALGPWVVDAVGRRTPPAAVDAGPRAARVDAAGRQAVAEIVPRLRELLALDVDQQWANPLSLIRRAVVYPTAVLAELGVPPVERDETEIRLHPDDIYGLVPAAFADLGPEVHERGLLWGAAKAHAHLRRHRAARPDPGRVTP